MLVQWLNSFHLSSDWSTLYGALNGFISAEKTPIIGIPYDYLYVVNSFKTLDVVLNDIANDKGNRAYFVFMDLPSDMYVYDEFCRVKPQDKWLAMDNYKWVSNKNLFAKRQAYQEQFSCMLGSLEQFMQKLNESSWIKIRLLSCRASAALMTLMPSRQMIILPSSKVIIWCCWQSKIPAAIISALTIRFARAGSWCAIIFTNKETAVNSTGWNFILRRRAVCRKSC